MKINPSSLSHFQSTGTITTSQYDVIDSEQTTERRAEKLFDILTCRPVSCIKRGCQAIAGNPLSIVGGSTDDPKLKSKLINIQSVCYIKIGLVYLVKICLCIK